MSENTAKRIQGPPPDAPASFAEGALVRSTSAVYKPYGVGHVLKVRAGVDDVEFLGLSWVVFR